MINNINTRIKLIRKQLEVAQKYMAESIGITKNYLSAIERGKRTPSDTVLIALMSRWGVMRDYLYDGEGDMFVPRVAEEAAAYGIDFSNRDIKDILEKISLIYNQGNEDQKAQLYGHVMHIYNRIQDEGGIGKHEGDRERRAVGGLQEIQELERKGKKKGEDKPM